MRKLRLSVYKKLHKCLDSDGDWDGTYDESYEYIIYDDEGLEVAGWDGYRSEEAARIAGEMRLKRLEVRSMKARIKGTGKIVDVDYIEGDYLHTSDGLYLIAELEGIESDIDYWTRLEHQYAGMAMQGILSNPESELDYKDNEALPQAIAACAAKIARTLVEKMKEERK